MKKGLMTSRDPDIIASERALRRAARRALQIGIQTRTPVYVIKHGRIVDIAEEYRHKAKQGVGVRMKKRP